jgi:hypothetical protein
MATPPAMAHGGAGEPAGGGSRWPQLLAAVLAEWHGAPGRARQPPPGVAPEVIARVGQRPPAVRAPLLAALRERLAAFPFEWVHPSWIVDAVPRDPLLRRWALGVVPPTQRRKLVSLLPVIPPTVAVWWDTSGAPSWFAGWWTGELRRRVDPPLPLAGSRRLDLPVTYVWSLADGELDLVLRRHGLRALAAAARGMAPEEVVRVAYALPALDQPVLVELVRAAADPSPAWLQEVRRLEAAEVAGVDLPLRLALVDLAANAAAHGFDEDARRLALRLPRPLGEELLATLRDGAQGALATADAEGWHLALAADVDALVAGSRMARPELNEESLA